MQIVALKHNGTISKVFRDQTVVWDSDDCIVFYSDQGTRVDEVRKGTHWISHYPAYKILLKNEYYNIVIVEKENGLEYYCNLATPPIAAPHKITYIDYDIDIILAPDGTITVHDIEEFHERKILYGYPDNIVARMLKLQPEIQARLMQRKDYFSEDFYRRVKAAR